MLGPTLETPRLILRPPRQEDFDGFAAMAAEEETMRYLGGAMPRDAAWRLLAMMAGAWALLGYSMFSVVRRDTGEWIGRLGPWRPGGKEGGWPGDEIGWGLKRSATGRGYAIEGATAAIDWAFDHLGWEHMIHCIDARNAPSIALALKLGSRLERQEVTLPLPNGDVMVDVYGQSKAAWSSRRAANPRG